MFTTVDDIRSEAGFDNNCNIDDTVIEKYGDRAHGILLSKVALRYNLTTIAENFTGSEAETLLIACEELLAAGYLLRKEYGPDALDSDKDGKKKIDEAMEILDKVSSGEIPLIDSNNNEYVTNDQFNAESTEPEKEDEDGNWETAENYFTLDDEF